MIINKFKAGVVHNGLRLDSFIAQASNGEITRNTAQRLISKGNVTLCNNKMKKNYVVKSGDEFEVLFAEPMATEIVAQNIPLDIVYEDGDVVVINKPKGMVVHPAPGHSDGTVVNALLYHCAGSLSGVGGEIRPGIVHRIDKDTSGLLIVAKNDNAHTALSAQLKDHSLSRIYEAVVCGGFKQNGGTIEANIGRHKSDRKKMSVQPDGRHAVTHYKVLGRYNGYTHIKCTLETGRTHQIRVHMAHIGHPILGDMVYGRKKAEKGLQGQCLHARELTFIHPTTGERVTVTTDLPDYFKEVLRRLGQEI